MVAKHYSDCSTIYGTLPTRGQHIYQKDAIPLQVSTIPPQQRSAVNSYKTEHYGTNYQERHVRSQHGYNRNCQDILRKSQHNVKQATFSNRGYHLNNPYSRHSIAVMDFHPYLHIPPSEFNPQNKQNPSQSWKLRQPQPVPELRKPLYQPKVPNERSRISMVQMGSQMKSIPLASRYPLHTVQEQDNTPVDIEKQVEVSQKITRTRDDVQHISENRIPVKFENRTSLTNIYNSGQTFNPAKKKRKLNLKVCKAACLFLIVSNLFFVLIIGCVVFSD